MKTRKKIENKFIRKIIKTAGGTSYSITLPIRLIRQWKWKERQKVILKIDGKSKEITIKDWKPKK